MNVEKKTEKELLQKIENLRDQVEKLKQRKKYGLVWDAEREPEKVVLDCRKKLPILVEDKKKEIKGKGDNSVNLLIEGDNYHSLSVLNYTHRRKVDVIYIDPPYNTGNKDFIYNDHFVDKDDNYRHSKWLNFMKKRIELSKDLLKSSGVIFISIDDNELSQLKILCDEIFEEKNFVANIVRRRRKTQANLANNISPVHEYILIYARDISKLSFNKLSYSEEAIKKGFSNPDNDRRGLYQTGPLARPASSKNKEYVLTMPNGRKISAKWSCSGDTFKRYVKENRLVIPRGGEGMPRIKIFLSELNGTLPNTWWDQEATNEEGAREIIDFFGSISFFEYPKPTNLLKRILELSTNKKSIILDYFAGSGTTGNAVLKLNKEDDGNRKFILCTDNQANNGSDLKIATDICYPRIKKVIKGYKNTKGEKVKGIEGNLRYYKTDFVETENLDYATDQDKIELTHKAGEMIAIREETFEEIEKDEWWQIFSNGKNITAIYFKEDKSKLQKLVEKLDKMGKKVNLYIFSWGKNEYANEFPEYKNIKVKDIPEPLIEVYKGVAKL